MQCLFKNIENQKEMGGFLSELEWRQIYLEGEMKLKRYKFLDKFHSFSFDYCLSDSYFDDIILKFFIVLLFASK